MGQLRCAIAKNESSTKIWSCGRSGEDSKGKAAVRTCPARKKQAYPEPSVAGLLERAADQGAAAAGAGDSDVGEAGRLALAELVVSELHQALRVVEGRERQLADRHRLAGAEGRDDLAVGVDRDVLHLAGARRRSA